MFPLEHFRARRVEVRTSSRCYSLAGGGLVNSLSVRDFLFVLVPVLEFTRTRMFALARALQVHLRNARRRTARINRRASSFQGKHAGASENSERKEKTAGPVAPSKYLCRSRAELGTLVRSRCVH